MPGEKKPDDESTQSATSADPAGGIDDFGSEEFKKTLTRGLLAADRASSRRKWAGRPQQGHVRLEGEIWVLHYRGPHDDNGQRAKLRLQLGTTAVGSDGTGLPFIAEYEEARAAGDRAMATLMPVKLPPGASPKWSAWCQRYLAVFAARLGPDTLATQRSIVQGHLLKAFGDVRLHEIDMPHVQRFLDAQHAAGVKPSTVRTRYAVLHRVLRCAAKEQLAAAVPVTEDLDFSVDVRVVETAVERALSEEQLERLLAAASGPLHLQIQLAVTIGLRAGEIFGLPWRHVHLDDEPPKLLVRQQAPRRQVRTTKTVASLKSIELPLELVMELRDYRGSCAAPRSEFLFPGRDDKPICSSGARSRHLRPLMVKLGIRGSFHSLRHSFGSRLGRGGEGLATIKDAMRLSSLKAAEVYVRPRAEDTARAIRRASLIGQPRHSRRRQGR